MREQPRLLSNPASLGRTPPFFSFLLGALLLLFGVVTQGFAAETLNQPAAAAAPASAPAPQKGKRSSKGKQKGPFASQQPQPAGATRPGKGKEKPTEYRPVDTRWRTYTLEGVPQYGYHLLDPYHQNRIKGDFPMFGQNWFTEVDTFQTAVYQNRRNLDFSKNPVFASQIAAGKLRFFSHNNFADENAVFGGEIRHNDDRFFPSNYRFHIDGAVDFKHDINAFDPLSEAHGQIFDAFMDFQLADPGKVDFNQIFLRGGIQNFKSDFHGLIFNDVGLGGRIFGDELKNRLRWDVVFLKLFQKDAVSGFIDFTKPSAHDVFITRLTWEDFLVKGWTSEWSFHFNHDPRAGVGGAPGLNLNTFYAGTTLDGHVGRFIFNPAIYGVMGHADHLVSGAVQTHFVRAWNGLIDLEYPLDYWKFRVGYDYASGDNPNSTIDTGFDAISDAVILFGGPISYLVGQDIKFGKGDFTRANSFLPAFRGANAQANYVNPGLQLMNVGVDSIITPRVQLSLNLNYYRFNNTGTFGAAVINHKEMGAEENIFVQWEPFLREINNTFVIQTGLSVLHPLPGLRDAFGDSHPVYSIFLAPKIVF